MKYIVYLDMDGVLADFDAAIKKRIKDPPEMFQPGFFRNLPVVPGAKNAVRQLLKNKKLDIYIGSKITSKNPLCATEKMEWIKEHFPKLLRRMVLVCDKKLLRGDLLIDDDSRWDGVFQGVFLKFDSKHPKKSWKEIVKHLEGIF